MTELLGTMCIALTLAFIVAAWQMWKCDKEACGLRTRLENALKALDHSVDENSQMFTQLSENIRVYEERAVKAAARYHAGTVKYEEVVSAANARWIEAARQNANLAEQLASIRLAHPDCFSEDKEHIENVSPSVPYSVELADWLSKFESPQARGIAVEQADMYRTSGLDDEQIIERLEEEWTA